MKYRDLTPNELSSNVPPQLLNFILPGLALEGPQFDGFEKLGLDRADFGPPSMVGSAPNPAFVQECQLLHKAFRYFAAKAGVSVPCATEYPSVVDGVPDAAVLPLDEVKPHAPNLIARIRRLGGLDKLRGRR